MKKRIISIILLSIIPLTLLAQSVLRGKLERRSECDTIVDLNQPQHNASSLPDLPFETSVIKLKGFEKALNERTESFIATNISKYHISKISILFRYLDMKNDIIHERTVDINCDIPSGATRQLSTPTFDKQKSYYYYLSSKPKKSATPFKVAYQLLSYDIKIIPLK